ASLVGSLTSAGTLCGLGYRAEARSGSRFRQRVWFGSGRDTGPAGSRRAGVTERLKDFIARRIFHPLEGMTFGDWWFLLRRHRFPIEPEHWPRVLVQTAVSASNTLGARLERWWYGRQVAAAHVQAPLFILGHYRSGTTHLHNLLALD